MPWNPLPTPERIPDRQVASALECLAFMATWFGLDAITQVVLTQRRGKAATAVDGRVPICAPPWRG